MKKVLILMICAVSQNVWAPRRGYRPKYGFCDRYERQKRDKEEAISKELLDAVVGLRNLEVRNILSESGQRGKPLVDVNICDENGRTLLQLAEGETLRALLETNLFDVNDVRHNIESMSLFSYAVARGLLSKAEILVDYGATIWEWEFCESSEKWPLAHENQKLVLKNNLGECIECAHESQKTILLSISIKKKYMDHAQTLVDHGAQDWRKDLRGRDVSFLTSLVCDNDVDGARFLCSLKKFGESFTNINDNAKIDSMFSFENRVYPEKKYNLRIKACVAPLAIASGLGSNEMLDVLLSARADPDGIDRSKISSEPRSFENTPLGVTILFSGCPKRVRKLLQAGAKIRKGDDIVQVASRSFQPESVYAMLDEVMLHLAKKEFDKDDFDINEACQSAPRAGTNVGIRGTLFYFLATKEWTDNGRRNEQAKVNALKRALFAGADIDDDYKKGRFIARAEASTPEVSQLIEAAVYLKPGVYQEMEKTLRGQVILHTLLRGKDYASILPEIKQKIPEEWKRK